MELDPEKTQCKTDACTPGQGTVMNSFEQSNKSSGVMKCEKSLEQQSDYTYKFFDKTLSNEVSYFIGRLVCC